MSALKVDFICHEVPEHVILMVRQGISLSSANASLHSSGMMSSARPTRPVPAYPSAFLWQVCDNDWFFRREKDMVYPEVEFDCLSRPMVCACHSVPLNCPTEDSYRAALSPAALRSAARARAPVCTCSAMRMGMRGCNPTLYARSCRCMVCCTRGLYTNRSCLRPSVPHHLSSVPCHPLCCSCPVHAVCGARAVPYPLHTVRWSLTQTWIVASSNSALR